MPYTKPQVLIIDPATHTPELDCFNHIAETSPITVSYHLPALYGMASINCIPVHLVKGIVLFGSGCSVYDNLLWHDEFNQWLKTKMKSGVPTFGCCYGHQLIAHIFGGKIRYATEGKSKFKGFRVVEVEVDSALNIESGQRSLVVSHNEEVEILPECLEVWAGSQDITIDGFRHKSLPIWGLQAHPEATKAFLMNQDISVAYTEDSFVDGHSIVQSFLQFVSNS